MEFVTNETSYDLDSMVIDLNWTLTVWGEIENAVIDSLQKLQNLWWNLYLLTWNQRWNADIFEKYWLEIIKVKNAQEKEDFVLSLDTKKCVAIWNARIDIGMFKHAEISIATLQAEWIHSKILDYADIIVPSMNDALSLFIDKDRFCATMKI